MALTPDEALERLQRAGAQNRFEIHPHARQRMKARGAQRADLKYGLQVAVSCQLQSNGRWQVPTVDTTQDPLMLICAITEDVLVITVF